MQGHPPLHWAALNNHQHVLQYLISVRLCLHELLRNGFLSRGGYT